MHTIWIQLEDTDFLKTGYIKGLPVNKFSKKIVNSQTSPPNSQIKNLNFEGKQCDSDTV